jgi:glycine/D-amino acid oxidase-like deaminating enzyme
VRRRDFLVVLAAPALVGLTRKSPRALAGGFVDDGGALGHRLRDGSAAPFGGPPRRVPVVIVGGGIAGLSAAWEFNRRGMRDFVLLEMDAQPGGNSRAGENDITAYPWAAHYLPIPDARATLVRELMTELGVLKNGVWEERYLCFTPKERLFRFGEWHEGITPEFALSREEREAFARFDDEIARERATGRFTIPMARGAPRESPLDRVSMQEWMRARGLTAEALRWYVDYACRDDFGALAADTSAWAGIHYFASRPPDKDEDPGPLTWPDGNAWIAKRLAAKCATQTVGGDPVVLVERQGTKWRVATTRANYLADSVVFAAPSFLAPRIVRELRGRDVALTYSPWVTANLVLDRWPVERGRSAPPSWDNVIYDSASLGYVVATHQSLSTRADRTVWTWYFALAQSSPSEGRQLLQRRTWAEWTEVILADLERAHPTIRGCVSRIDVMRMGHAMVRPRVGSLANSAKVAAMEMPGLYLANSDLSTISLFEEAQYRGVMAARRALERR